MNLPAFLFTPEQLKRMEEAQAREVIRRLQIAEPWTDDIRWAPEMTIKAKTFKMRSLFNVKTIRNDDINSATMSQVVQSPKKNFVYAEKLLKRGDMLETASGRRKGTVLFDQDIAIPCIHEVSRGSGWNRTPWMSITPMEVLTLRTGTRLARGNVIVAGLGLGYQLVEVSKRSKVKEITLVEKSQELVDWLLPRIEPHLARPIKVIVGDAYKVLPKLEADVALVDIFPSYGFNEFSPPCAGIKKVWCWGGATYSS